MDGYFKFSRKIRCLCRRGRMWAITTSDFFAFGARLMGNSLRRL